MTEEENDEIKKESYALVFFFQSWELWHSTNEAMSHHVITD